ncbi:MAG: hypothetical protein M3496_04125 [Pseudomonadota bacterium]|nr:hypothetical protein [Pseudomonadota bacterium]
MAQLIVRDLEDERHGRSMEEEVRDIPRNAVKQQNRLLPGLTHRRPLHENGLTAAAI